MYSQTNTQVDKQEIRSPQSDVCSTLTWLTKLLFLFLYVCSQRLMFELWPFVTLLKNPMWCAWEVDAVTVNNGYIIGHAPLTVSTLRYGLCNCNIVQKYESANVCAYVCMSVNFDVILENMGRKPLTKRALDLSEGWTVLSLTVSHQNEKRKARSLFSHCFTYLITWWKTQTQQQKKKETKASDCREFVFVKSWLWCQSGYIIVI